MTPDKSVITGLYIFALLVLLFSFWPLARSIYMTYVRRRNPTRHRFYYYSNEESK